MTELLGQGGYGCVFYPKLKCDGRSTKNYKYVSKLQIYSREIERELRIGKKLKEVPKHYLHFAVILDTCSVNINSFLKNSAVKECEVVQKRPKENYILSKITYIKGSDLKDYYNNINHEATYLLITLNEYYYLINSLQILLHEKIIHFDIKFENIMQDVNNKIPIIIDFGLSFYFPEQVSDLKILKDYFYIYAPDYYIWCPEIQYISLIVNNFKEGMLLNETIVKNVTNQIVEGMGIWNDFSEEFRNKYTNELFNFYKEFIGKDNKEIIEKLLTFKKTWDNYSLSISFLRQYIKKLKRSEDENIKKILISMTELFLYCLSPDPNKRPELSKIKQVLYDTFIKDFKHEVSNEFFEYKLGLTEFKFIKNQVIPHLYFFTN